MIPPFRSFVLLVFAFFFASALVAQATPGEGSFSSSVPPSAAPAPLPNAPSERVAAGRPYRPSRSPYEDGGYAGGMRLSVACGGGMNVQRDVYQAHDELCGAGITIIPYTVTELGVVGLQDNSVHFYVSEDFVAPITKVIKGLRGDPLGLVGYTKIVGNSNRFDYGVGWEHHIDKTRAVSLEARDYLQFTSPVQHMVMLRLSFVTGSPYEGD